MKKRRPRVGIVMGSDSDAPVMEEAARILDTFGVSVRDDGHVRAPVAGPDANDRFPGGPRRGPGLHRRRGAAAHLPGVVAAETTLPVIGVPIDSSSLAGLDALLSIVQMPGGVPVATMAIGKAGAKNAGILAVQILAEGDPELRARLAGFKGRPGERSRPAGGPAQEDPGDGGRRPALTRRRVERVRIEPGTEARAIARAAEIVRAGGVIAFPTDTYYGLGADPMNAEAVARIFAVKRRAPESRS